MSSPEVEFVDIVDENCAVVGSVPKSEAHQKGLLHKTVIAEVVDSKGRWLLIKQAGDRQDAGQYVSPVGGHVKAGEADEGALKREAQEELGLKGDFKYEYIDKVIFNRSVLGRQENHYFIMYKIYSDAEPILNHESVGFEYLTEEELSREIKENPKKFGAPFHFQIQNLFPHLLK